MRSMLTANLPPEKRRSLLCIPPPGEFDANCSSLQWVKRVYDKKSKLTYDSVFVPYSRVDDFLAGECYRGGCLFYRKKVQRTQQKTTQVRLALFSYNAGLIRLSAASERL